MKRKRSAHESAKPRTRRKPSGAAVMQPAVTEALTRALLAEWARTGYGALSLETVAKRAGVGKAALYRRWHSKLDMVRDCLKQVAVDLDSGAVFDTGSLEGDVRGLLGSIRKRLGNQRVRRILPDLHAEILRSPELASIADRLGAEYRRQATGILERAIARRELSAEIDVDVARDALAGMIYWRMIVVDEPAGDQYLDQLTRFLVAGLRSL